MKETANALANGYFKRERANRLSGEIIRRANPTPSIGVFPLAEITFRGNVMNRETANRKSGKTTEYLALRKTVKTLKKLVL